MPIGGIVPQEAASGGNPLVLAFLLLGLLILVALVGMAIFQRRMYADQIRQVRELLQEAKRLSQEEAAGSDAAAGETESGTPTRAERDAGQPSDG